MSEFSTLFQNKTVPLQTLNKTRGGMIRAVIADQTSILEPQHYRPPRRVIATSMQGG